MSDPFYESREWLDLRYKVLKKSRGMCQCCGHRGDETNPLQVDHILARARFRNLELSEQNLQVLCRQCNLGKGYKDHTDWRTVPSRELSILNSLDPIKRFKLQQLGWLKLSGETALVREEAHRQYRKLWREVEADWLIQREAAQ